MVSGSLEIYGGHIIGLLLLTYLQMPVVRIIRNSDNHTTTSTLRSVQCRFKSWRNI